MDKHHRIFQLLEKEQLDAVLVAEQSNVRYLSRFSGDTAYLYISPKRQVLMTDSRYTTWAKSEAEGFEILQVDRELPYETMVQNLLEEDKAKRIGFENQSMIYSDVMKFRKQSETLNHLAWVCLDNKLSVLRQIKTPQELEYIRYAEKIGDTAFSHIISELNVGMTEREVAWEIEDVMRKEGADGLSFETIVVFGDRTAMPHAVPSDRKLQRGDLVLMDFGCVYQGYCSDMTRTVVMGQASMPQKKMYNIVLEAQLRALSCIRSGIRACDVDRVARQVIEDARYGEYFGHGLGHSVGLAIHESPSLSPKDTTILREHMLETVEPGIYVPGFGGVRIEDLVIITENGCENLTHSTKELLEL